MDRTPASREIIDTLFWISPYHPLIICRSRGSSIVIYVFEFFEDGTSVKSMDKFKSTELLCDSDIILRTLRPAYFWCSVGPLSVLWQEAFIHFEKPEVNKARNLQIFEPFGTIELVQVPLDLETGQCKDHDFVQFAHLENANLNGKLKIAG